MKKNIGTCKLCLKDNIKIIKSHIIPKFLFEHLKNDKGQMVYLDKKGTEIKQNEPYEYLMCEKCDNNIIGYYEKHFKSLLSKITNKKIECKPIENNKGVFLMSVDYKLTRLFYLSLLWRMSVASIRLNNYNNIKLPCEIEERLRNILLNNIEPECDFIPISLYMNKPEQETRWSFSPWTFEGNVWFVLNGSLIIFNIKNEIDNCIKKDNNGTIILYYVPDNFYPEMMGLARNLIK